MEEYHAFVEACDHDFGFFKQRPYDVVSEFDF